MVRRSNFSWGVVALGGVIVVAGAAALTRRRTKDLSSHIALIGDSYAVGLGPELQKIIPDFKYEGHVGTSTSAWANHTAGCGQCGDWLTAFRPKTVLVSLGVNDGTAPNIANYQRIVQGLNGIGANVVWIEPPAAVNTQSRNTIASLGGLYSRVPGTQTPLAADGLHPQQYNTWAREIATAIGA